MDELLMNIKKKLKFQISNWRSFVNIYTANIKHALYKVKISSQGQNRAFRIFLCYRASGFSTLFLDRKNNLQFKSNTKVQNSALEE